MSDKINVCLIDKSNKRIDQIIITRPKNYGELLNQIETGLKISPVDYKIFYINKNIENEINDND